MTSANKDTWNAEHYSKHSSLQYQNAFELFDLDNLQGDESILDIGCGDGKITALIAAKVPNGHVVGIDSSQSMIDHAVETHINKHMNLNFICQDATVLNINEEFDIITSFNCIHWITEHDQLFNIIASHMKQNGLFYAVIYPRAEVLWKAIENISQNSHWKKYFPYYSNPYNFETLTGYKESLKKAGFKRCFIEVKQKMSPMKSIKDLELYIAGWLPHLSEIPTILHNKYLNEIGEEYLKLNNNSPNLYYEQFDITATVNE